MDISVSDKALKATTKCTKGFSCLRDQGRNLCKVESCVAGEVLFLECLDDKKCPYAELASDRKVCFCPVRKELFKKHRI